jgi:hypothetical protein
MKTRAMFVSIAVMVLSLLVFPAFGQRRGGGRSAPVQGRAIPTNPQNSPSTPIQPMTNPVAPTMNSPVQPFVNYNNPPRTSLPARSGRMPQFRGDRDRRRDGVVVVDGGYIASPYGDGFDPFAYAPFLTPAPIPGQLPYTYPLPLYSPPTVPGQLPNTYSLLPPEQSAAELDAPAAPVMVPADPVYYPEPEIIIPADSTEPIKELPTLGATRSQVEAKYGQPWGVVGMHGKETMYYRNGLVVVFETGQAVDVRKR